MTEETGCHGNCYQGLQYKYHLNTHQTSEVCRFLIPHCSPLLHSSAISISHSSIWDRRVVRRLSFSRDFLADTHMMIQINSKLIRSTSTTGPTITGMMRARFSGSVVAVVYVSVPTVKFKFVPIITWRNEKTFNQSPDVHTASRQYMYSRSQMLQTRLQVVASVVSRQSTRSKCFNVNLSMLKLGHNCTDLPSYL